MVRRRLDACLLAGFAAISCLDAAFAFSFYGHSFYGEVESSSRAYGALIGWSSSSPESGELAWEDARTESSSENSEGHKKSTRPARREATGFERQVAFRLEIQGLDLQILGGNERLYGELTRSLAAALQNCAEEKGAREQDARRDVWYHKIGSAKGSTFAEVEGHFDFGKDAAEAGDFARVLKSGDGAVWCSQHVMGNQMRFTGADVVSFPPALTSGLSPGKLPDRKSLQLEQLSAFKSAMDAGKKKLSAECVDGCCNLESWVSVGNPRDACYGRGKCLAGKCQCDAGYTRQDCGECATGYVPVRNSCQLGSALWGSDLTQALAEGNFWMLENSAGNHKKEDTGSRTEVALPPAYVPKAFPSNNTSVNSTVLLGYKVTSIVESSGSSDHGRPAPKQLEDDVEKSLGSTQSEAPIPLSDAGSHLDQGSTRAIPRHSLPEANTAQQGLTLLEHATPSPLPANPRAGQIEFLSPAAGGLFAGAAKRLSSPTHDLTGSIGAGSRADKADSARSFSPYHADTGSTNSPSTAGMRLPPITHIMIAVGCGLAAVIVMVSCSISYNVYARHEQLSRNKEEGNPTIDCDQCSFSGSDMEEDSYSSDEEGVPSDEDSR